MINWKVRFKNWSWVAAFLSQILIIVQVIFAVFNTLGVTHFQLTDSIADWILTLANAIFVVLSLLGIVQDPTTNGFADSEQALKYDKPK